MERPKTDETLCFVCQEHPITHTVIKGTEGSKGSEKFGVCEMCGQIVIEENDRMNALKKAVRHADSRRIFTYMLGGDLNPIKIQIRRNFT